MFTLSILHQVVIILTYRRTYYSFYLFMRALNSVKHLQKKLCNTLTSAAALNTQPATWLWAEKHQLTRLPLHYRVMQPTNFSIILSHKCSINITFWRRLYHIHYYHFSLLNNHNNHLFLDIEYVACPLYKCLCMSCYRNDNKINYKQLNLNL